MAVRCVSGEGAAVADGEAAYRRTGFYRGRVGRKSLTARSAAEAIGVLSTGVDLYGLTRGQFSLVDLIEAVVDQTGPVRLTLATWTASGFEVDQLFRLLKTDRVLSLRLILDRSFPTRHPEYCQAARECYGDDCIRLAPNHAKFVVARNGRWSVAIRTSMNLTCNRRIEHFELSDDAGICDYLDAFADQLWAVAAAGEQFDQSAGEQVEVIDRLADDLTPADVADRENNPFVRRYRGDGDTAGDVRRAGFTTSRGGRL